MKKKKKDIFNPAFKNLKKIVKESGKKQATKVIEEKKQNDEIYEQTLFNDAMAGVTPIPAEKGGKILLFIHKINNMVPDLIGCLLF